MTCVVNETRARRPAPMIVLVRKPWRHARGPSDIPLMRCFGCSGWGGSSFAAVSRAAAKSASAKLRKAGALRVFTDRGRREAVCAGCPLRTVVRGVAHCGRPFLRQVGRPPTAGCGCPIADKAASAAEHCPLGTNGRSASRGGGRCNCRWCERAETEAGRAVMVGQ